MATVNQQIDALLKRRGNPARKGKSPNWVVHLRNFATKKSKTVTMPGGLSEPEAMRNAVLKAGAYWQVTKVERDLNENPRVAARSVVLVAAKNPRVNKYAPSHRVESSLDKKSWVHYGDFLGKAKASEVAKLLHESHPDLYIRVVTIK